MAESYEQLFPEFPPVPTTAWEEKIVADLKGADYEKKLVWKTDEGFDLRPYYREENLPVTEYLRSMPGEAPFTRGNRTQSNSWMLREDIPCSDPAEANRLAREAVSKGVEALGLCAKEIAEHKQMKQVLEGIDPQTTPVHFTASRSYPLTLELFLYELQSRSISGNSVSGSLNFDPISYLLLYGDFYISKENNFEEAEYLLKTALKKMPKMRVFTVNGHYYRNAGSTIVQELAFSLASASEYLAGLTARGISADDIASRIQFTFGTGSDYFPEIAKLRAARFLWTKLAEAYGVKEDLSKKMFIHSVTNLWNKSLYDPYVNMLRTTVEGMAAAIGNSDSVTVLPFDQAYRDPDDFSRRIARNQQLIFREESYLDKIVDPSAGSYYIENLTHAIATHAWKLFQTVEEKGGLIECIKSGFIQGEVEKSASRKVQDLAQRKLVMIGTNQYPNPGDAMISQKGPAPKPRSLAEPPACRPLKMFRGSEEFEALRLATEAYVQKGNKRPSVFLLTMGNLTMRKARATFSTNFFGCAGFEILDNPGFKTSEEGISAALASGARVTVICSSDEEYATLVPAICTGIRQKDPDMVIVVAGYPKELLETLKAAGVNEFIHIRSNVIETLKGLQKKVVR
jgi:methylmalonyl-CoA mutase